MQCASVRVRARGAKKLGHIINEKLEIFGLPKEKNKKGLECGAKERN